MVIRFTTRPSILIPHFIGGVCRVIVLGQCAAAAPAAPVLIAFNAIKFALLTQRGIAFAAHCLDAFEAVSALAVPRLARPPPATFRERSAALAAEGEAVRIRGTRAAELALTHLARGTTAVGTKACIAPRDVAGDSLKFHVRIPPRFYLLCFFSFQQASLLERLASLGLFTNALAAAANAAQYPAHFTRVWNFEPPPPPLQDNGVVFGAAVYAAHGTRRESE